MMVGRRWICTIALGVFAACTSSGDGTVVRVEGCEWPGADDPRWSWPIGYGLAKNSAHTTFVDQLVTIEPWLAPNGCFTGAIVEIVEPPRHGTATITPEGAIDYQPAPGFIGFDPLVARVGITRSELPECEGATPPDELGHGVFLDGETDAGGFDLVRIGVHVVDAYAYALPACTEDCVELDVLVVGGLRIPTFTIEQGGPDDHPRLGCTDTHWRTGYNGHLITGDVRAIDYPLDEPGVRVVPASGDEEWYAWYGSCGYSPVSVLPPTTVRVSREAFEGYCEAVWHNQTTFGIETTMMTSQGLAAGSLEGPAWEPDWPEFEPDAQPFALGPKPYQSVEELEKALAMAPPQSVINYITKIVGYLHAKDEPYYRALRWGAAWGDFEAGMLDFFKKREADEWSRMTTDEQVVFIDDLLEKLDTALGQRFQPLKDYVMGAKNVTDKVNRISKGFEVANEIYKVFNVDPDDPLNVAEALSRYIRLLAHLTDKTVPPLSIYVSTLADGLENALPHLRAMRDRTRATNRAIDDWLAPTEEFLQDWQDFAVTESSSEEPALDMEEENPFHAEWADDIQFIKMNTWDEADTYSFELDWYLTAFADYYGVDWEYVEQVIRARFAGSPDPNAPELLQQELDKLLERQAARARTLIVRLVRVSEARAAFRKAREHWLQKTVKVRGANRPEVKLFLQAYGDTLRTQIGDDPWAHTKQRQ